MRYVKKDPGGIGASCKATMGPSATTPGSAFASYLSMSASTGITSGQPSRCCSRARPAGEASSAFNASRVSWRSGTTASLSGSAAARARSWTSRLCSSGAWLSLSALAAALGSNVKFTSPASSAMSSGPARRAQRSTAAGSTATRSRSSATLPSKWKLPRQRLQGPGNRTTAAATPFAASGLSLLLKGFACNASAATSHMPS
mmetsp:Transcript_7431/g.20114  ORF Transcript_7431/g.20114 Transcript_7431/m.20114 type:complete len:202 (+) Transcript_7431:523-1128(+)